MAKPDKRASAEPPTGMRRFLPAWIGKRPEPTAGKDAAQDEAGKIPRLSLRSPGLIALLVVTVLVGGANYWQTQRARTIHGGSGGQPGTAASPSAERFPPPPDPYMSTVAEATERVVKVFGSRGAVKPKWRLENPTENGVPLVFLVEKQHDDWLHVHLPVRPNGSKGWVKASDVEISHHRYRIVVRLSKHRISVYEGPERILRTKVAIGTQDTPTPGGVYYIKELLKPPNPNTVYGTYAYGLSGFSNALETFKGVPAVIGIHGTNDPSVVGTDVSAGCIRMRNKDIEKLVPILPLGTPVVIKE